MMFIDEHVREYPLRLLCKVAKVSRSGYYGWKSRSPTQQQRANSELLEVVRAIHASSRGTYGRPRLLRALRRQGLECSSERLRRLMLKNGISSKHRRKYRATTNSQHRLPVADNLVKRNFTAERPNRLWVADTTFIATREGWAYLAAILDVFSRSIVGWAIGNENSRHLCLRALDMATARRSIVKGLIHHSDQGSTYASGDYQKGLAGRGIICSMSAKGDCWDNAMMESFFHTLKVELIRDEPFPTRAAAVSAIFEYIEVFYNRKRLHSGLGFTSPADYERKQAS
jgi:transposase InsO family protein